MSRTRTRTTNRRYSNFTSNQVKSLVKDGKYRHRDISKLSDFGVPYDTIKNMEEIYRENDPSVSQNKRAKRTATALIKAWRTNNSGSQRSTRTRRRRGRSSSTITPLVGLMMTDSAMNTPPSSSSRSRRRGSRSSSSRRSSNSSGTRRRRRSSSRSLHLSDL